MITADIESKKKYVGTAKIVPASRMPRRFPTVMSAMTETPISTRASCRLGIADVTAATPAAVLTETVST